MANQSQTTVSTLRPRLANRHAEKLIPPHELGHIQALWDRSEADEKVQIFCELDGYGGDEMKRLFTLLSRQSESKSCFLYLFQNDKLASSNLTNRAVGS